MQCGIATLSLRAAFRRFVRVARGKAFFFGPALAALSFSFATHAQTLTGLSWDGTAPARRMLLWDNPPAMYPATYLFKVFPRDQVGTTARYSTTFFWGNNGDFAWGSEYGNSFYGAHPYPIPSNTGPGKWEISSGESFGSTVDRVVRDDGSSPYIVFNRWYSQAFTARNTQGTWHQHKFYVDLPSIATANTITATRFSAPVMPPDPSIVMGQSAASDSNPSASWGGYPRWEEANEIIRGIQIYDQPLTQQQILNRQSCDTDACVLSVCASDGACPWYLNMNPTPSDVSDRSGRGHHPTWEGSARPALWTNGSTPPPSAPVISSVGATNVTTSSATVGWSTDKAADSLVEYGTTTSYGQATPLNTALVTSHSTGLSSLVSGTTYHFRVHSSDASGNAATSGDFVFTTSSAADTTPPIVSAVSATNVTTSSATITWTTNEPADSQVDYGTTTSYGQSTPLATARVTSHAMNLSSLPEGTTLHYRVRSRDAAGNAVTSSDFVFTTASAGGDTTPPSISGVNVSNITGSSATINWTTNEPADSQVEFGVTASLGQVTVLDPARVTSHVATLSGLAGDTAYHFRVRSRDAAGNLATGVDTTFSTLAGGSGATPAAAYGFTEAAGFSTVDSSGNGFNGTLVNGPVWTSGHGGNAILFDGVDDKVVLPAALDIATLPFTLEAWIQPTSRADYRKIFSKRNSYSSLDMRVDVGLRITTGSVYVTTQRSYVVFTYAPPLNSWTHVAIVAESSGTKLYVNGVLQQTLEAIILGTKSDAAVAIGSTGDNDDPFAGTIDDVRLYKRALTGAEIQADMGASVP